jgi:hypothetical protein
VAYGDDITEAIPYVLSNPVGAISYSSNAESYDIAINDMPFFLNTGDEFPYGRQTSQYRKQQIDQSNEPGEQSITGWWVRAQSSFHNGTGIKFYDPSVGETVSYRFADSRNLDVWTKGKVTLLKETANMSGVTTGIYKTISIMDGSTNKILGWIPASTTIKNYTANGTAVTYTDVTGIAQPLDTAILAVATDGTNLFIADNDHIYTGPISTPAAGYSRYYNTGSEKVVLGWVKQRLVACIGASVYELTNAKGSTHALPTAAYTHPNADWTWTSISESGGAIYAAGYAGGNSAIYKFTLSTAGVMPTLTSGVIAAQLPIGELVNKIEYYLGYLMIGTNKGVRAAQVSDQDGSIAYGPLIFEESNGVYDFAFRDRFVWATGSIDGCPGLYRIDLSNEIEPLRFAYATDAYLSGVAGYATSVDFVGNTEQIAFTTSGSNGIAIQSTTTLASEGYITTGKIRYGTLENKVFKTLKARIDNTNGELNIKSIDTFDTEYSIGTFSQGDFTPEVSISYPVGAQEYISLKFVMSRSSTDTTKGAVFNGYQLKSLPAISRQRLITYPLACYDREKDSFGNQVGHEGAAYDKLVLLEAIENVGDTIRVEDFRTGESYLGIIEQLQFLNRTPSDKRFSGFGGILVATIRTI